MPEGLFKLEFFTVVQKLKLVLFEEGNEISRNIRLNEGT